AGHSDDGGRPPRFGHANVLQRPPEAPLHATSVGTRPGDRVGDRLRQSAREVGTRSSRGTSTRCWTRPRPPMNADTSVRHIPRCSLY
ncbi:unnamed protein product, partial [Musa hybrid cultivar]